MIALMTLQMNKPSSSSSTDIAATYATSAFLNASATTNSNVSLSTLFASNITDTSFTTHSHNTSNDSTADYPCLWILYEDIGISRVRIWDVVLFVPNLIFLVFVMYRIRRVWHRILSGIGSGGSPIFVTYFILVALAAILAVIRGIVSMTVDFTSLSGSDANKILWIILRLFLLLTELSVLVFGLAFGHLDSKTSIKRVLFVTTCIALVYSTIQCTLELVCIHPHFETNNSNRVVYSHGGALFCLITSCIFFVMYVVVALLPFVKWLQRYLAVPTRRSFYVYVAFMAALNFISTLGSGLLLYSNSFGLCLLDAFSLAYFTLFAPLVYWTFLSSYFGATQPSSMMFSYATHVDESLADVADFDLPANGINIDSTLSGILVFNQADGGERSYQVSNGHSEEQLHSFGQPSTDEDTSMTSPSVDSTHSFIRT